MKATTIASTVSRYPSRAAGACTLLVVGFAAARGCKVAVDRPIVLSFPRWHEKLSRWARARTFLANVTNSPRVGNPAKRPPKNLERHELARQVHQERLADEHRPAHDGPFAPEPGVI